MVRPAAYNVNPFDSPTQVGATPDPVASLPPPAAVAINPNEATPDWHSDSRIDNRYEFFEGILTIPVAGPPGTPPEIVRVHAPYGTKVSKWTAERRNKQPFLPDWDTNNPNEVRTYRSIQPASPTILQDQSRIFRTQGQYHYVITVAPKPVSDTYAVASMGPDANPANLYSINRSHFDNTILDSSGATF